MIKRPKPSDTEEEILKMQSDFLSGQAKNENFQPAAKLVKVNKPKVISKFAEKRLEQQQQKQPNAADDIDVCSTSKDETAGSFTPSGIIIGNIVERKTVSAIDDQCKVETDEWADLDGFPKPKRIDKNVKLDATSNKSLFAQAQAQKLESVPCASSPCTKPGTNLDFGHSSYIVENSEASSIHKENLEFLRNCGENEILQEQKRLLGTLDSSIVQFLQQKRKKTLEKISEIGLNDVEMVEKQPSAITLPEMDVLNNKQSKNWLHFDVIETEKLAWMRDLPTTMPDLKPGQAYEARFDWKGVLLPFTLKEDGTASNELFLHGDDAHRPGYTLQELFRLARSTMPQQRISALGAIGGILSIYNQGYYDGIFELPISKIFFLLRYAFDDNTPGMLEVSAKAMSALFYNETDEILLDVTFDCSFDCIEPTLKIHDDSDDQPNVNLADQFAKMNIKSNVFQASVINENEQKVSSMNDFHLAETDLIQCLLRTNILQRISYIFTSFNHDNSTKLSCAKILIRLARTCKEITERLLSHSNLVEQLFQQFSHTPNGSDYKLVRLQNTTKVFILKLFRIICAYGTRFIDQLRIFGLDKVLKNCIFVQENSITVETVKIQIEALRCIRTIVVYSKSDALFDEMMPALRYTLEWLYQFVDFQNENHFLFRQCASALIALLGAGNSIKIAFEKLPLCFSKWFLAASKFTNLELSQVTLLATCLNAIQIPDQFRDFLHNYLTKFLTSTTFRAMCDSLSKSSGILASYHFRQQDHTPLPHLHSIVFNTKNSPVFIVSEKPTIYLISSIVRFLNTANDSCMNIDGHLNCYIQNFAANSDWTFATNWFLRREISFAIDLLRSKSIQENTDKAIQLNFAYKVLCCLNDNQVNDILYVFAHFIFNIEMYANRLNLTAVALDQWKSMYGKVCVEHYLNSLNSHEPVNNYNKIPMLSSDWPCLLLLKMYKTPDVYRMLSLPEKDVICTTLSFLSLQNANEVATLNQTTQLLYTMIAFLDKNNTFLEPDVNEVITKFVRESFRSQQSLNFDADFNGKFNFENLYISFLDQFQGTSYGDRTFGVLVMAPLAQKHNIKWRHMVWSEHIHVLRFVTCNKEDLIGDFNDYLSPAETDAVLVKSYYQAINSKNLLPDSVPYKIAEYHVNEYKSRLAQPKN